MTVESNLPPAGGPTDRHPAYGFVAYNLALGAENGRRQSREEEKSANELDCDEYE